MVCFSLPVPCAHALVNASQANKLCHQSLQCHAQQSNTGRIILLSLWEGGQKSPSQLAPTKDEKHWCQTQRQGKGDSGTGQDKRDMGLHTNPVWPPPPFATPDPRLHDVLLANAIEATLRIIQVCLQV